MKQPGLELEDALKLRSQRRFESAERAVSRVLRRAPSLAGFVLRAELRETLRREKDAVTDLDRALKFRKPPPTLYRARARLRMRLGQSLLALADFTRALKSSPRDEVLREEHAEALAVCAQPRKALLAFGKLLNHPTSAAHATRYRLRRVELKLDLGGLLPNDADLRVLCAGIGEDAALGFWHRGRMLIQQRKFAQARIAFNSGAAAADSSHTGALCRDYQSLCSLLRPQKKPRGGRLLILGLGMLPPTTATQEIIDGLGRADVLFDNVGGGIIRDFLLCFRAPKDVRLLRGEGLPEPQRVKLFWGRLSAEISRGKTVAFVTRGNAHILGAFAHAFLKKCRQKAIPVETFGSVSMLDVMAARAAEDCAPSDRLQAFTGDGLKAASPLDKEAPLILLPYADLSPREVREASKKLRKTFGTRQNIRIWGPRFSTPPLSLPIKDLPVHFPRLPSSRDLTVSLSSPAKKSTHPRATLTVLGFGVDSERTLTWQSLAAFEHAERIFTPVDETALLKALAGGKNSVLIVPNCPWGLTRGDLNLLRKAQRHAIVSVLPAVSPIDDAVARTGIGFGEGFDALRVAAGHLPPGTGAKDAALIRLPWRGNLDVADAGRRALLYPMGTPPLETTLGEALIADPFGWLFLPPSL
jgi:tetratricopeptide (TPR) repeat protein